MLSWRQELDQTECCLGQWGLSDFVVAAIVLSLVLGLNSGSFVHARQMISC